MPTRPAVYLSLAILMATGCVASPGSVAPTEVHYKMFLVYRIWSDDLLARAAGVTETEERAHQRHIENYSRTALSSNLQDENGAPIGVVALNAYETREGVEYYIYEDPYTKAGFYKEITIIPVEVEFVDEWFAIEPEWIQGEGLATKHRRYVRDNIQPVPF